MRIAAITAISVLMITACSGGDQAEQETNAQAEKKPTVETVSLDALKNWLFLGTGTLDIVSEENALRMSETEGSVGVTLVSPKSYGKHFTLSFKVRPESYESVNVVILSASDVASGSDIVVPGDYDGGFPFWTAGNVQDYIVAFHNGAHNRLPFITKSPDGSSLGEGEKHVAGERWHDVEISREDKDIRLTIDGVVVVEGTDTAAESLPGGNMAFRLRGTPDALASALFKDVVITKK